MGISALTKKGATDVKDLERLRHALDARSFDRLLALTDHGQHWPFGEDGEDVCDSLLLEADEEVVELLLRCQEILGLDDPVGLALELPEPPVTTEYVSYDFDGEGPLVDHFLGSLRQNGLPAVAVEQGGVRVIVTVATTSPYEAFQIRQMVQELHRLSRLAVGRPMRGHRLPEA